MFELEAWDCVVSIFFHIRSVLRRAVHGSIPESLRHDGCFVLEAHCSANIERGVGGPQNPDMTVELYDVLQSLGAARDIRIEIGREVEREIVEGTYHNGVRATTQVLALRFQKLLHY